VRESAFFLLRLVTGGTRTRAQKKTPKKRGRHGVAWWHPPSHLHGLKCDLQETNEKRREEGGARIHSWNASGENGFGACAVWANVKLKMLSPGKIIGRCFRK
jgi:hypothetical protein